MIIIIFVIRYFICFISKEGKRDYIKVIELTLGGFCAYLFEIIDIHPLYDNK